MLQMSPKHHDMNITSFLTAKFRPPWSSLGVPIMQLRGSNATLKGEGDNANINTGYAQRRSLAGCTAKSINIAVSLQKKS